MDPASSKQRDIAAKKVQKSWRQRSWSLHTTKGSKKKSGKLPKSGKSKDEPWMSSNSTSTMSDDNAHARQRARTVTIVDKVDIVPGEASTGKRHPSVSGSRRKSPRAPAELDDEQAKTLSNMATAVSLSGGPGDQDFSCEAPDGMLAFVNEHIQKHAELEALKLQTRALYEKVKAVNLHGEEKRLLFVTNQEAEILASSPECIMRLLDAFHVEQPQIVINLLHSIGTMGFFSGQADEPCQRGEKQRPLGGGLVLGRLPWASRDEAAQAEKRLDLFMSEVVLPKAIANRAVVLVSATRHNCLLSDSFNRVVALQRAKWSHRELPFTVLAFTAELKQYCKNDPQAHGGSGGMKQPQTIWADLMRQCEPWRRRHETILSRLNGSKHTDVSEAVYCCDMNPIPTNYIVVEGIDYIMGRPNMDRPDHEAQAGASATAEGRTDEQAVTGFRFGDKRACNALRTSIVSYLTSPQVRSPSLVQPRHFRAGRRISRLATHGNLLRMANLPRAAPYRACRRRWGACANHRACTCRQASVRPPPRVFRTPSGAYHLRQ